MNDKDKTTEVYISVPIKIKIMPDGEGFKAITEHRKCESYSCTPKNAIEFLIENIQNLV